MQDTTGIGTEIIGPNSAIALTQENQFIEHT